MVSMVLHFPLLNDGLEGYGKLETIDTIDTTDSALL